MYNGSPQSNFRKRRKTPVNLKPINPLAFKAFSKFLRIFSYCFKREKVITIYNKTEQGIFTTGDAIRADISSEEHEPEDISPLLREITTNFFENQFRQCSDTALLLGRNTLGKITSNTSLPSACTSISKKYNRSGTSNNKLPNNSTPKTQKTNSAVNLNQETKPCISASGFLTTSFFSLPQAPEYSTYPVQINLRYAEEPSSNGTNNRSVQYCEKDYLDARKDVRTSTKGLQSFNDNSTQSENVDNSSDCLEHSITQKVAHFFEITPIRKKRPKPTNRICSGKFDKATNTSAVTATADEPTLLYVNSTVHFASTDDTTVESKFDSEDENINRTFKQTKHAQLQPQVLTRNCCTSTSGTCICSEKCPKEWCEQMQNKLNPNFHIRQMTKTSSHTTKASSWNKEERKLSFCQSGDPAYETSSNKEIDCEDAIKKLSEFLVNDTKSANSNMHRTSFEKLRDYVQERNLVDILNQRYPTFIGFQFNNNETKKIKYTINRKSTPVRRRKVPKIIIREKRKYSSDGQSRSDFGIDRNSRSQVKSKASVISIATNSANMLEIRDIIQGLLPKGSSKFQMVDSEKSMKLKEGVRISNQSTDTNSIYDDLLRLEVEKIVDELLDEIPSTSQTIYDRSSHNSFIPKQGLSWNTKDSLTSLSNEFELQPVGESVFRSIYTEEFPSQTVIPLFHRFRLGDIRKKIRTEEKVRFELVEPKSETQEEEGNKQETITSKPHPEQIENTDADLQNSTIKEELLRQYNLNKGFFAQIIQKTTSLEHPLVCSKISHSSTKSSVHSFIKSLLLCLKYADSSTALQNASVQCNEVDKSYSKLNLKKKRKRHYLMPSSSSHTTQSSLETDGVGWDDKLSVLEESEKVDKANMAYQPMNSVGIQVLVATNTKDKEVSPALVPSRTKKSVKRDTFTQTNPSTEVSYHNSAVQHDAPPQKQRDVVMYPSFANKKVSEIQTGTAHFGVLPSTMEQEIKPNDIHDHKVTCKVNSRKVSKFTKNLLPLKTQSAATVHVNAVRDNIFETSSVSKVYTPRNVKHLSKMNNEIRKCRTKFERDLYTDLGDGDVQKITGKAPLSAVINHGFNSNIIGNNPSTSTSLPKDLNFDTVFCPEKLCYDSYCNDQNNSTIFVYRTDNKTNKNQQNSTQQDVNRVSSKGDLNLSHDAKDGTPNRVQDNNNESYPQDEGSDIYKFKPDETIIDEIYLERIIHLWLKSGLRQHISQLSNLKLIPIYEWGRRHEVISEEPTPVLETLDVEPVHITTERLRRSRIVEKSSLVLKKNQLLPKDSNRMDDSIFPTLITQLQNLEKDRRFKIEISTSESSEEVPPEEEKVEEEEPIDEVQEIEEQPEEIPEERPIEKGEEEPEIVPLPPLVVEEEVLTEPSELLEEVELDIEPALANVGGSIEKLTAEFADWLIAHGIPLWKISQIGVQTSLDGLPRYKAELEKGDPINCKCDVPAAVTDDDDRESALKVLRKVLTKTLNKHYNYATQKITKSMGALEAKRKKVCLLTMTDYNCILQLNSMVKNAKVSESSDGKTTSSLSESDDRETHSEISKETIKKEMLSIINGIIDQLQSKIKDQIIEKYSSAIEDQGESFDKTLRKGSFDLYDEKQFPNNPQRSKGTINDGYHKNQKLDVSSDEPTYPSKEKQTQTCLDRSKLLKQLCKYLGYPNSKLNNKSAKGEEGDDDLKAVQDKSHRKTKKAKLTEKYNLYEAFKSLGDKIIASSNPNRTAIPVEKILGRKLYSTCEKAEAKLSERLGISQNCCFYDTTSSSDELCDRKKKQKCEQKLKVSIRSTTRSKERRKIAPPEQRCFCNRTWLSGIKDYDSTTTHEELTSGDISTVEDRCFRQATSEDRKFENVPTQRLNTNTSIFYSSKRNEYNKRESLQQREEMYRMCFCDFEESKRDHTISHSRRENERRGNTPKSRENFAKYANVRNFILYENEKHDQLENKSNYKQSLMFAISSLDQLMAKLRTKLESCADMRNGNKSHSAIPSTSTIYDDVNIRNTTELVEAEILHTSSASTDGFVSDTFTMKHTDNATVHRHKLISASESSLTPTPRRDNRISLSKNTTRSENSVLYDISNLTKKVQSVKGSSCIKKQAEIKTNLDDFLADIVCSWISSQSSLTSEKSSLDTPLTSCSTLYHDYMRQRKHLSRPSIRDSKIKCARSMTSQLSKDSLSDAITPDGTFECRFGQHLRPENVDDVKEIIKLLSKLCPRALCNYYVKKMQR